LGAAQMSLDLAISHTKIREAFGKTISQFQWTQFKLAEMAVKVNFIIFCFIFLLF